jgi:hypothetical protein
MKCPKCKQEQFIEGQNPSGRFTGIWYPHYKCTNCGTVCWAGDTEAGLSMGEFGYCGAPEAHWQNLTTESE